MKMTEISMHQQVRILAIDYEFQIMRVSYSYNAKGCTDFYLAQNGMA